MRSRAAAAPARASRIAAVCIVAILAFQVAVPVGGSAPNKTTLMTASLPTARDGTAAATVNGYIYIFGGDSGVRSNQIVRYDAIVDQMATMGATLPSARSGASAVAAGSVAYIFGGWDSGSYSTQIVRYNPTTDTTTVMGAQLPSGRSYTSAIWTGSAAYLFGGGVVCAQYCTTDQIVRYTPDTDTVTVMSAKLPSPRYGTSAVWTGSVAYIFGGVTASTSTQHDQILRYDPATDELDVMTSTLPTARYHTSAAFSNGRAYIMGGFPCAAFPHYCKEIVSFQPAGGVVATENTVLTTGRYLSSAAARGNQIYIFGGYDGARSDDVLRFSPGAAAPPTNQPPVIDLIDDFSVVTGDTLQVTVTAMDPDGDELDLSIVGLPGGATFVDAGDGTGTLQWHTAPGAEGVYAMTARADDGYTRVTQAFTVTVDDDPPPVIRAIAARTVVEGASLQVSVIATDPANDAITLSVAPLPAGSTFVDNGDGTGTFAWNVAFGQRGVYDLTVTASDAAQSASRTFRVTVLALDRAPVWGALPDTRLVSGSAATLQFTASDADGDPIALSAPTLPAGATFSDLGAGVASLTWTPQITQTGAFPLRLVADAGAASVPLDVLLTVAPPFAFTFAPLTFGFMDSKPGERLSMDAKLTNTGYYTDTYSFTARYGLTPSEMWPMTAPSQVTLQPGASTVVSLIVDVPNHATLARPRLVATSDGQPTLTKSLTSVVTIPVRLAITLDEANPTVAALDFLEIQGEVRARWYDGSPVVGQQIRLQNVVPLLDRIGSQQAGPTNATGIFRFDFSGDAAASLPGEHELRASLYRYGRTDRATETYTIDLA